LFSIQIHTTCVYFTPDDATPHGRAASGSPTADGGNDTDGDEDGETTAGTEAGTAALTLGECDGESRVADC
jgi:hypothetical protein